uniref:GLOBIN domain-containing protein n=1 Tax=Globodera pallida TaxID=36090 RepID=A0A183CK93_GLOPA
MGNAESKSANPLGGSGKLRQSKKATKEKRSCSEQLEQQQLQLHTEQLHKTHRCCCCCERQQKARKSVSSKFIRMPRRLAPKTSEGTVASGCCCTRLALRVPRMAEDTVAMSRTTVTSAAVEERVAMAAVATAVRWHDLNRASLATAGAVLSAAVCGTAKPKRREGNDRNGVHPRKGGGSTKSDRTAPSVGRSSVAFGCAADRPDAVTVILADYSLGDNVSLDEINLAASGTGTAATGGRLGDGIRRQRPAGRSFNGRRAKSFRHQQIRSAPPAGIGLHQPSTVAGGLRPRPQTMANGAIEQQFGVPCPITGLTLAQKRLILVRWRQLPDADMLRLSENIFERTFRRNESFARTILRQNDKNWKNRTQFRVLTMRFSNVLSALCASLEDYASSGAELLAEFGAQHALGLDNGQIIPPSFWDVLLLSICEAAGAGEGQQMECFAPAGCALSAGSSLSASSSGVSSSPSAPAAPMLLPQWTRRSADAWAQFAVFVSAQMRFGYEMERFLRERMRKRMQEKSIARRRRSLSANGSLTTNLSLPETIERRRGERSDPEGEQLK